MIVTRPLPFFANRSGGLGGGNRYQIMQNLHAANRSKKSPQETVEMAARANDASRCINYTRQTLRALF